MLFFCFPSLLFLLFPPFSSLLSYVLSSFHSFFHLLSFFLYLFPHSFVQSPFFIFWFLFELFNAPYVFADCLLLIRGGQRQSAAPGGKGLLAVRGSCQSEALGLQRFLVAPGPSPFVLDSNQSFSQSFGALLQGSSVLLSVVLLLQFPPHKFPAGVWLGCVDLLQIDRAGLYLTYLSRERVR